VPQNNQVLVQELREDAPTTLLAPPKQRGGFGLECQGLAFSEDGTELAALFNEAFFGLRVVSWDLKRRKITADHPFPKGTGPGSGEAFFAQPPKIEWLPGKKGWQVCGMALVDYKTGALQEIVRAGGFGPRPYIRVLTGRYLVSVDSSQVRLVPVPDPKGE
jgi:hypothetical protein